MPLSRNLAAHEKGVLTETDTLTHKHKQNGRRLYKQNWIQTWILKCEWVVSLVIFAAPDKEHKPNTVCCDGNLKMCLQIDDITKSAIVNYLLLLLPSPRSTLLLLQAHWRRPMDMDWASSCWSSRTTMVTVHWERSALDVWASLR